MGNIELEKHIGKIYTREDTEKLGYQNKYIVVELSEEGFWYYLSFIAVLISSFSLGVSVAVWILKIL